MPLCFGGGWWRRSRDKTRRLTRTHRSLKSIGNLPSLVTLYCSSFVFIFALDFCRNCRMRKFYADRHRRAIKSEKSLPICVLEGFVSLQPSEWISAKAFSCSLFGYRKNWAELKSESHLFAWLEGKIRVEGSRRRKKFSVALFVEPSWLQVFLLLLLLSQLVSYQNHFLGVGNTKCRRREKLALRHLALLSHAVPVFGFEYVLQIDGRRRRPNEWRKMFSFHKYFALKATSVSLSSCAERNSVSTTTTLRDGWNYVRFLLVCFFSLKRFGNISTFKDSDNRTKLEQQRSKTS